MSQYNRRNVMSIQKENHIKAISHVTIVRSLLLLLEGSVSRVPYIGASRIGGLLGLKLGKSLASRRIST